MKTKDYSLGTICVSVLQRIKAAVVRAVAIGPFIVARRKNDRILERIEIREAVFVYRVLAESVARLDVSDVNRERDSWIAVDVGDQTLVQGSRVHLMAIGDRLVRHIANGGKGELR